MSAWFLVLTYAWLRREPGETKVVCSLGQDDSLGHKVLEERCLVRKKECAAGDLSAGSLSFGQEEGTWYRVFKGGVNGGFGDGCLRCLLFRGFAHQMLKKDSGSVF